MESSNHSQHHHHGQSSDKSSGKRERGYSQEFGKGSLGLEELTIMKLMEEIMEFDQEIKMK